MLPVLFGSFVILILIGCPIAVTLGASSVAALLMDGSFDLDIAHKFASMNIYTREKCGDCWAKFYCSGGCNANNWQYEGDILHSHPISCELEKKRIECAIMIQAVLSE